MTKIVYDHVIEGSHNAYAQDGAEAAITWSVYYVRHCRSLVSASSQMTN